MQVFRDAIEKNGGPLPLAYYLQPDAGSAPDQGPLQFPKHIDLLNTRVDRRSFFECLLHDKNFAILSTFLVSGVSVNAVREEDGATALHIATAATLDLLDEDVFFHLGDGAAAGGGRINTKKKVSAPSDAMGSSNNNGGSSSGANADFEEDAQHRTDRVLNPTCPNQLILNFLIDNGADVNAPMRNSQGQTPLMVAAARQNIKVAKLLLAKGADMYAQDASGRTALTYAARYPLVLEALRVWMGEENFMRGAVRERLLHTVCRSVGNRYAALYLIEQVQLDVNARDDAVQERIGAFESNNTNTTTSSPPTAIHTAAVPSSANTRSPLLNGDRASPNLGSPVEMVPMNSHAGGDTPLHCAVSIADVALVRALLSKGADVHATNRSGLTPLRLAQSPSQVGVSWKQYWKEELVLLLRPASPSAAAARRRRRHQHHECNPAKVRAILTKFNNTTPGPSQEKLLQEETAQYIWQVCTPMDYAQFIATAVLPHLFFYLYCCVVQNFFLLLCLLPLLYASYVGMQRRDANRPRSRPLAGLGWCFGFVVAQGLCLPLFTTRYYYKYYSFELEEHAAISWWLIPSAIVTFVCVVYLVVVSSPGVVTTTEGQRKGIYASLRNAKGNYAKELLYGIDLRTMVKKPLRAQYCVQLQRVVLRYDQFCTYFSTVIGGGNQRAFFWAHVALLSLLSCFYHYAREYGRLMGRLADVANTAGGAGNKFDQAILQKIAETPFSTAELRFGYMYTQVILPVMIVMDVYALYNQLCLIARNLTVYDLEHAEDESSVYCFTLGSTAYSLYDHGMMANFADFFGWSSFTQVVYRVPQINTYLQQIVEDYQRWQLTAGDGCCGDDHAHSHGQPSSGAAGGGGGGPRVEAERVGPAEYGDDESYRTQQMLEARQRQALLAAQTGAAVTASTTAAAAGAAANAPHNRAGANPIQNSAAADPTAVAVVGQSGEPHGLEDEAEGEYYDEEGEEEEDPSAQANSVLAMQIFQQMVRSGSTDVGRGGDNVQNSGAAYGSSSTSSGGVGGTDAETQREWDEAVLQARKMFDFYRQSLGGQGED